MERASNKKTHISVIYLTQGLRVLRKVKFFGLRFGYYKIKHFVVNVGDLLFDMKGEKLVSKRKSRLLFEKFDGRLGHGISEREDFYPGLGMVLYSFVRCLRPKRVLCVGSQRGFVPALCALACEENALGGVDFVDAGYDSSINLSGWGQDGFWKRVDVPKHFHSITQTRLQFYLMTTKAFCEKYPNKKYDYIYIDGDHTYDGVRLDYKLLWPMLNRDGFMFFHDILGTGKKYGLEFGVKKFWSEIPNSQKININFPKQSGLGILQKSTR